MRLPPVSTLFPYTTLFRSPLWPKESGAPQSRRCRGFERLLAFTNRSLTRPQRRSEEHTSELQSRENLVCRLLLEKKNIDRVPRYLVQSAVDDRVTVNAPLD